MNKIPSNTTQSTISIPRLLLNHGVYLKKQHHTWISQSYAWPSIQFMVDQVIKALRIEMNTQSWKETYIKNNKSKQIIHSSYIITLARKSLEKHQEIGKQKIGKCKLHWIQDNKNMKISNPCSLMISLALLGLEALSPKVSSGPPCSSRAE